MGRKFSGSHRRLYMPSDTFTIFHRWIHMSNQEYWVFPPEGISIPPCYTQHMYFSFPFSFMRPLDSFGRCPILPSPPLNTKHNVDLPCTHDMPLNTKHNVDLYHALTPMSCDVPCINAMQCYCMYLMSHA